MYGLLLEAIGQFIRQEYGENVWNDVRRRAKVEQHTFSTHVVYSESILPRLADAAAEIVGTSRNIMLAKFGHYFVAFTSNYGYDRFLRVLGRNMRDFLNGLDNLHDYMHFTYAKLKPPSFCVEQEHEYGLTLHYRSKRKYPGFTHYVRGQIEAVGKIFYHLDVVVDVVREEIVSSKADDNNCRSCNMHVVMELRFDNERAFRESLANAARDAVDPMNDFLEVYPSDLVFCELFPFHISFTPDMKIQSTGKILNTIMSDLVGRDVREVFMLKQPLIEFTWELVLEHRNSIFELHALTSQSSAAIALRDVAFSSSFSPQTEQKELELFSPPDTAPYNAFPHQSLFSFTDRRTDSPTSSTSFSFISNDSKPPHHEHLVLKGQMLFVKEWEALLYVPMPKVANLKQMLSLGNIFLHDLPVHDSVRDLALLSGSDPAVLLREALQDGHDKTDALEEALRSLDAEQERSDALLYQMLPQQVADRLRAGEPPVNTCKVFESVTVLVSDIVGFTAMCSRITPLQVVRLLNSVYSAFDSLCEQHQVYKIETIGDAYLVVAGAPEAVENHAERIARMAFDMIDAIQWIDDPYVDGKADEQPQKSHLRMRIGVDSGSVVAGVVGIKMPRYCLFGNTVRRAFKMEATCQPMRVHVTDKTYQLLQDNIHFDAVEASHVDLNLDERIETFYLDRIQNEQDDKLSNDASASNKRSPLSNHNFRAYKRSFSGRLPY